MTSENPEWASLGGILDDLLDLPEQRRSAEIASIARTNPALAKRASAILELAVSRETLADVASGAAPDLFREIANGGDSDFVGERLGAYRVVEPISRGGMGLIFRGERADGTFEQAVAIKLIPAAIAGERAVTLFERERQLLARLEHPNIARIIDAGLSDEDTPFYVMELVDGLAIDAFAIENALGIREFLLLVLQLCDAVAYCHQSMVVHGDIKPANVLVADGRVRLVDFGIGRLLREVRESGVDSGLVAYSPGFASPEQQRGDSIEIASDVYSLGALIEHCLGRLSGVEGMPADIAAICQKCLAELPEARYSSVDGLQQDLRAYLDNYPVRAQAPTRRYRSKKFVQRNTLLVGSTLAVVLALATGLGAALLQYQRAHTEALRAEQSNRFLSSLFERANPVIAGEDEVTLKQVVDDAASRVAIELEAVPAVQNEINLLIGNAYFGLGEFDKAMQFHQTAFDYWSSGKREINSSLIEAQNALATDWVNAGDYAKAESLIRDSIARIEDGGLSETELAYRTWTKLGAALAAVDADGATAAMHKAHDLILRIRPDDTVVQTRSLGNIAVGYRAQRNIEESVRYHEMALELSQQNEELLAPEVLTIRCNLALDYGTLGEYARARDAQLECIRLTQLRLGDEHPANVPNLNNLGALELRVGRLQDAKRVYKRALAIAVDKLPPRSLERMAVEINLGVVQWHSGEYREANIALRDVLARMEASMGPTHPAAGRVRTILGRVALQLGDADTARLLIESSIEGLTPYWRSDAQLWRAEVMLAIGDTVSAEEFARDSLVLRESLPHFTDWQVAEASWVIGAATADQVMIGEALNVIARDLPPEHFRRSVPLAVHNPLTPAR